MILVSLVLDITYHGNHGWRTVDILGGSESWGPKKSRYSRNCKSLPFFYFLPFEKGRLPFIHPVGWLVGRSVGWSASPLIFSNIYIRAGP